MTAEHPAEYSAGILEGVEARGWLPPDGRILDPFGGAGRRLHEVLARPGRELVAVEIEPAFVERWPEYLTLGDATALPFEAETFDGAVTSPPYAGVRFADYDRPRAPKDWKGRRGYDLSAKYLTGDDTYTLHERNAARFVRAGGTGDGYWRVTGAAWREVARMLRPDAPFVLNHSVRDGDDRTIRWHLEVLTRFGFDIVDHFDLEVTGYRFGAGLNGRRQVERVVLLRRRMALEAVAS